MSAKFTSHIREFIASALLTSIENAHIGEWTTGVTYNIGTRVTSNGNVYVAATTGTSGAVAPSHLNGSSSDGSLNWIYLEKASIDKLYEGNMFIAIGKPTDWETPLDPDDVESIDSVETAALKNLISLKSIKPTNMKACAPRNNWTSGAVYSAYDSKNESTDYVTPFYVISDTNDVYKCLDNFSGAQSTSQPSGYQTIPFRTVDGYVWKYLGSVSSADATIFMTDQFVPLSYAKSVGDNPHQWAAQEAAQRNSISGFKLRPIVGTFSSPPQVTVVGDGSGAAALAHKTGNVVDQVYISNAGSGYTEANTYAYVTNGSVAGSGAVVTATPDGSGTITTFNVVNGGSGYTAAVAFLVGEPLDGETLTEPTQLNVTVAAGSVTGVSMVGQALKYKSAKVYIVPGSNGALALPIMAPVTGHGSNIVRELNASTVMISTRLTNTVNDTGYFLTDTGSDFHQISLVTDIIDNANSGYATGDLYIGPSHPNYSNPGSLKKMKAGAGVVLYINNIKTVIRSASQEEDIKIAVTL